MLPLKMDMVRRNVTDSCEVPHVQKVEMHPLTKEQMGSFMELAKRSGHQELSETQ